MTIRKTGASKKAATKPKRAKADTQPQQQTVTIPFPDTDSDDEANSILARDVPGWDTLDKDDRAELLRLIRDHRKRGTPVKVKMTRKTDGGWSIEPSGKSEMLALLKLHETFSANSIDPVNARANELLKYLGSVGADNEARYNAALSFIESMAPRDQAEALLLVQMYVTHDAAIRALSQLGSGNGCRPLRCSAIWPRSCCAPLRGKWKRWPGCVAAANRSCVMFMLIIAAGRPSLPRTSTQGVRKMGKSTINPMQPDQLASAPRCLARTRLGTECQSPTVKGRKRCRMHGGTNPGAPKGNRHAWKHGGRSADTTTAARYLREIARLIQ